MEVKDPEESLFRSTSPAVWEKTTNRHGVLDTKVVSH
jgi:hypothetical protein